MQEKESDTATVKVLDNNALYEPARYEVQHYMQCPTYPHDMMLLILPVERMEVPRGRPLSDDWTMSCTFLKGVLCICRLHGSFLSLTD